MQYRLVLSIVYKVLVSLSISFTKKAVDLAHVIVWLLILLVYYILLKFTVVGKMLGGPWPTRPPPPSRADLALVKEDQETALYICVFTQKLLLDHKKFYCNNCYVDHCGIAN